MRTPPAIVAWHGTRDTLQRLDVAAAIARGGAAQHGEAFYLTSSVADGLSYALPSGHLWRCLVDPGRVARTVTLGDGITHHLVADQGAILESRSWVIWLRPARKLCHGERKAAARNPEAWGLKVHDAAGRRVDPPWNPGLPIDRWLPRQP